MDYELNIINPTLANIGYILAVANIKDKHDRSAPSDYHWKILKCRMLIFSHSSILACPDKQEVKKVHILFNKIGDDYDILTSLFMKFSLSQDGIIKMTTPEIYQMCFQYTMTAKLAPAWNTLGINFLVNDRHFLTAMSPVEGVKYSIATNDLWTTINVKPIKLNLTRMNNDFLPGEFVRVLPSLNKAVIVECSDFLPQCGLFKSYKDLRRHWKNIHGYRLPEEDESSYCLVRFWRGEPLTYPKICVTRNFPIVIPIPKSEEKDVMRRFQNCFKGKMSQVLGMPLKIQSDFSMGNNMNETLSETQAICLCTPTQVKAQPTARMS